MWQCEKCASVSASRRQTRSQAAKIQELTKIYGPDYVPMQDLEDNKASQPNSELDEDDVLPKDDEEYQQDPDVPADEDEEEDDSHNPSDANDSSY
jgi:hypothetical protein